MDIKIGEADAGLLIDVSKLPAPGTKVQDMTTEQKEYVMGLPSKEVLDARTRAYKRVNSRLEDKAKGLQAKSSELEGQMLRVIGLCTGVPEGKVEGMMEQLKAAVRSEREEVDVGRVREFLRRVEAPQE